MSRIDKTVFISYRRTNKYRALAIYQDLTHKGFDVFFDYINIPSGDFEEEIISNIKARSHFIAILTPSALERCANSGDWLRKEIEAAIDFKRNIIPLFFEGFNFGEPSIAKYLTGKLEVLKKYNGLDIPVSASYFFDAMEKLRSDRFLRRYLELGADEIEDREEVEEMIEQLQEDLDDFEDVED